MEFDRELKLKRSALHPLILCFFTFRRKRDTARGSIGTAQSLTHLRTGYWGEEIGQSERSEWNHFGCRSRLYRTCEADQIVAR